MTDEEMAEADLATIAYMQGANKDFKAKIKEQIIKSR